MSATVAGAEPALESTQFLVAVASAARQPTPSAVSQGRVVWLLDLFVRLERQKAQTEEGEPWNRALSP